MPSSSRASRCCSKASRKTKERTQSEDHKAEQGPLVPVTSWVWLVESRRQTSRGLRGPWPHCPRPGRRPATHRNWPGAFDGERSFLQLALLQQRDLLRCRNARRNLFLPANPVCLRFASSWEQLMRTKSTSLAEAFLSSMQGKHSRSRTSPQTQGPNQDQALEELRRGLEQTFRRSPHKRWMPSAPLHQQPRYLFHRNLQQRMECSHMLPGPEQSDAGSSHPVSFVDVKMSLSTFYRVLCSFASCPLHTLAEPCNVPLKDITLGHRKEYHDNR